jgi:octaprenyl-diphosphate synthase
MIFSKYSSDLEQVDKKIKSSLSVNSDQVRRIFHDSYLFKGKKIRPIITILSYRLFENDSPENLDLVYTLAAGVELLHCASLIHDDINDSNKFRRGMPTINSLYGNTMAQILGDLLFVKSFELCGKFDNEIVEKTAISCSNIAEGEILQLQNKNNVDIEKETILKIEEFKTASVFGTSAYCGASLAKAGLKDKISLFEFGIHFGLAFQLVDDILDYTGSKDHIGKNNYQDIAEGKITLPLYFALNDPSTEDKKELFDSLNRLPPDERNNELKTLFEKTKAIEKTYDEVNKYCKLAKRDVNGFTSEDFDSLIDFYSKRTY